MASRDEEPIDGCSAENAVLVEQGELYEPYIMIEPDVTGEKEFDQVLEEWVFDLDDLQVVSAMFDFHERWTWDSGTELDRIILERLEEEYKSRKRQPGDIYFNKKDECSYAFDGRKWIKVSGTSAP